jgi:hypothetical protein
MRTVGSRAPLEVRTITVRRPTEQRAYIKTSGVPRKRFQKLQVALAIGNTEYEAGVTITPYFNYSYTTLNNRI